MLGCRYYCYYRYCCTRRARGQRPPRTRPPQRSCVSSWDETPPCRYSLYELWVASALPDALRVKSISQSVSEQVEGQYRDEDGQPRKDHVHRVDRVEAIADRVRQHPTPARLRRDDANPEVGQPRLEQDVGRDQQRGVDQDRP